MTENNTEPIEEFPELPEEPVEEVPVEEFPESEPELPEDPPRQSQPTNSNYLKISRALDGSDFYNDRLNIALEINGLENTRAYKIFITKHVADYIDATEDGSVYTDRVTDEMVDEAIDLILNSD